MNKVAETSGQALAGARDTRSLLGRYADVVLALAVVGTVGLMIVPLPTAVLDVLITANIAAAVTLMLVAIYVGEPLKIATFPTLLLLTTLFRVAIEVAATRLILLQADAGDVISAFGRFVVSGNLVVGVVIFLILTLVQFVVVAKGAERVAEVGARFTLDAMPGKQLAIDAELRAGHINRDEAQARRRRLGREAQFFGAMDGAMKFVKGDAIAGLLILVVNIVGGLVIGVFQRNMAFGDAARTYTILTIGEGLVAQIPALVISTAAGVLVTRVSAEDEGGALGKEIGQQVLAHPKALAFAAGLLAVMAAIPGLPAVPFLLLAVGLGFVALRLLNHDRRVGEGVDSHDSDKSATHELPSAVGVRLGVELAEDVQPRLQPLLARARTKLFETRGIDLQHVRVDPSRALGPRNFVVTLHDVEVLQGSCPVQSVLALTDAQRLNDWPAVPARHPQGREGAWVPAQAVAQLQRLGIEHLDAAAVVADHVAAALDKFGHELVGVQEAQTLLDAVAKTHPALVHETVPKLLSVSGLAETLRRLAEERVSLRHLRAVLETLAATRSVEERTPEALSERSRQALRRALTNDHASSAGLVSVFVLDPMIEETLQDSVSRGGRQWALEPELMRDVQAGARRAFGNTAQPLVLTHGRIRRAVWHLLAPEFPASTVLSYDELLPETTVETLGRITPA